MNVFLMIYEVLSALYLKLYVKCFDVRGVSKLVKKNFRGRTARYKRKIIVEETRVTILLFVQNYMLSHEKPNSNFRSQL